MNIKFLLQQLRQLVSLPSDPELLRAQCAALSRHIPMLYFILVANSWVLAVTFFGKAPSWLTVDTSLLLTAICICRLFVWWQMRAEEPTVERAVRELRRTNLLGGVLAAAFSAWAFALFPYGDAYSKSHVVLFLTISIIGSICCLIHLRTAALIIVAVGGTAFVGYFATAGIPALVVAAINVALVTAAVTVIVLIQSRDFARMVKARADAERREQEQSRLLHMIDDMPVAVMTVDPETLKINYANETSKRTLREIEHLLPIKADDIVGTSIDVFHKHPEHQRKILADPANLPHRARIKLGPEVLDLQVSAVMSDSGKYLGPMLSWAIVTKQAEAENRIQQLARYDTLTGLANRNTFEELMGENLSSGSKIALLFVDLDGFKIINDSKGHHAGDALLKQVAGRLRSQCRGTDMTVGRIGGDEFAVLIPYCNQDRATVFAAALINAVSAPYEVGHDTNIRIGASIGIAFAPMHGADAETLLSRSDMALYEAKAAGKGSFKVFVPEMESRIQERVRLEVKLRNALDTRSGLFVFYQPIVDIHTREVTAREALVRWHHPKRGWVSPGEFVPVAEQSGLIEKLGIFVLNRACRDAVRWEDDTRVAVNVSAGQLGKGTLVPAVLSALLTSGLPANRLEIEITETALMSAHADNIGDLRKLRSMGVRVALDDFGTGYSSLAHLREFPFNKIKIDGSFVKDAVSRPDCAAVVRSIADLGKRLGVTTVAEGVETEAHLARVAEEGCSEVQGYLFGRPEPPPWDLDIISGLRRLSA